MPGYRVCMACGERRPLFAYRGVVKADRHHNLCFECYRAEGNRLRAWNPCDAAGLTVQRPAAARSSGSGSWSRRQRRRSKSAFIARGSRRMLPRRPVPRAVHRPVARL